MNAAQYPLISIVLCTFNGEKFLAQQIESVLQQTYTNLEIIISDDASIDSTKSILQKYLGDERVKLFFQQTNIGYIKNFEFALAQARGDFIAFCDQDDIWLQHKIEKLFSSIDRYTLVYGDSKLIDENGLYLNKNLSDVRKMYTGTDTKGFILRNIVSGHSMMIKRELLSRTLPVPQDFFHDEWFAVNAAVMNGILYVNEPLTLYRQHGATVTKTIVKKNVQSRTMNKRYEDFQKQLRRIKMIGDIQKPGERHFYEELYSLVELKGKGKFVWSLFFFLLKNEKSIFRSYGNNFISRLIEIRKLSRGEKYEST